MKERICSQQVPDQAKIPHTDDNRYDTDCRADCGQSDPNARFEIAGELPDVTGYDIVFPGYPIRRGQAPRIIDTFLESVDPSDKRIILFCTSGSGPIGSGA